MAQDSQLRGFRANKQVCPQWQGDTSQDPSNYSFMSKERTRLN